MILKLTGRFSLIDKYDKLHFVYNDPESANKLANHCTGIPPYSATGFTVRISSKRIPDDIRAKIGRDCTLHVRLQHYRFRSKLQKNMGEEIIGTHLILESINIVE